MLRSTAKKRRFSTSCCRPTCPSGASAALHLEIAGLLRRRAGLKAQATGQRDHRPVVGAEFQFRVPVTLEASGILSGTVAARSLHVRDGGQVLGQFHILEGKLESLVKSATRWHWRCANAANALGCSQVLFEPHEPG